jgi:hypothetical protein
MATHTLTGQSVATHILIVQSVTTHILIGQSVTTHILIGQRGKEIGEWKVKLGKICIVNFSSRPEI